MMTERLMGVSVARTSLTYLTYPYCRKAGRTQALAITPTGGLQLHPRGLMITHVANQFREMDVRNLEGLFRAESVAIIGASDKNPWTAIAARTLEDIGYSGVLHLVNRRGTPAMGRDTLMSCADAEGGIAAAFIAVPAAHLADAIEDMAAGGVKYGAVVTSGFGEVGEKGAELQRAIFARAEELGIILLGPNSLGFTNFVDRTALGAMPMPTPALPEPRVALVSQSGATTVLIAQAAHAANVPLSHMVAMGNEAMVDLADVVRFFVADKATRAIGVFAESIRNPAAFLCAAGDAFRAGKPIVMLKVGVGELTAAVAQAHTGALVGDDKVFQAVCDAYNIVRVSSIEDLVVTADMLAVVGPVDPAKGFALASISGGACEIVADRGEEAGVPFPQFDQPTLDKLAGVLSDYGAAHNPLDITGAAMAKPSLYQDVLRILGESGQFALIGVVGGEIPASPEMESPTLRKAAAEIASGLRAPGVKGMMFQQTLKPITAHGREFIADFGLPPVSGGLDHATRAVGKLWEWSRGLARVLPQRQQQAASTIRLTGERETLAWLARQGVPVIPQHVANSREQAVAVAGEMDGLAVLKILSPDIAHKTEVGGVLLNVVGPEAVGAGYDAIMERVAAATPEARIEGVLVSPMRSGGQELIVGVARDPEWGLVLALGIGGVWVELLGDSQLRLLPVSESEVIEALGKLKAAKLLTGYRGSKPANLAAVARVVVAICNAASTLGSELETLEINPLWVNGEHVEALDALAIWRNWSIAQHR
jgi:acetate---CoA ligase (ADP-forming)